MEVVAPVSPPAFISLSIASKTRVGAHAWGPVPRYNGPEFCVGRREAPSEVFSLIAIDPIIR